MRCCASCFCYPFVVLEATTTKTSTSTSSMMALALRVPSQSLHNSTFLGPRPRLLLLLLLHPHHQHQHQHQHCPRRRHRFLSSLPVSTSTPPPALTLGGRPDNANGAFQCAAIREKLKQMKIHLSSYEPGGQRKTLCPMCGGGQSGERSLSVNISDDGYFAKWNCFRGKCGWKGYTETRKGMRASYEERKSFGETKRGPIEEGVHLQDLSPAQQTYFRNRGITIETLNRNGVKQQRKGENSMLVFPYREVGEVVGFRNYTCHLNFEEEVTTRKILYGLDDIKDGIEIIIVAREVDKLALEEAGYLNCVSVPHVPHGAQTKTIDKKSKSEDKDFEYLWNCQEYLVKASRIILATGSDDYLKSLAEELARRIGRERCWRVNWPLYKAGVPCKDPLEVLQFKGRKALSDMIETSELYPIRGLFQFCDFDKEIDDYYHERSGNEQGVSTGWKSLDSLYKVVPGELTLITGVPSSGKSEWIDALLCNLNRQKNWSFALCSMENQVKEHGRKLLEKYLRKPFFNAMYSNGIKRMSAKDYELGKAWLDKTFYLIRCENDELPSIQWVLDVAKSAVMRYGIRGLVIDPYNELDHQRPANMTETEYVSQILTKIKRFAQHHECHVWFVAHPKQLQAWRGDAPSLYDISGSAHFVNKCDVGLVVHRNRDADKGPVDQVQIIVRKVRNKAAGTVGDAILDYDRVTGEYKDYR